MSTLSDHMRNGDAGPTDDHADAAERQEHHFRSRRHRQTGSAALAG